MFLTQNNVCFADSLQMCWRDHLPHKIWAKSDLCLFFKISIVHSRASPTHQQSSFCDIFPHHNIFPARYHASRGNKVKPSTGMCTASPACTHAQHSARIHSCPPPLCVEPSQLNFDLQSHSCGHSGAAETSWEDAVDISLAFKLIW